MRAPWATCSWSTPCASGRDRAAPGGGMARVVVTGATAGFGEAIARAFVARGDDVWGTGRRNDRLDALAAELGDRFRPLCFDLLDPEATRRAVADLEIDVLVSNAGLALGTAKAWETDL